MERFRIRRRPRSQGRWTAKQRGGGMRIEQRRVHGTPLPNAAPSSNDAATHSVSKLELLRYIPGPLKNVGDPDAEFRVHLMREEFDPTRSGFDARSVGSNCLDRGNAGLPIAGDCSVRQGTDSKLAQSVVRAFPFACRASTKLTREVGVACAGMKITPLSRWSCPDVNPVPPARDVQRADASRTGGRLRRRATLPQCLGRVQPRQKRH